MLSADSPRCRANERGSTLVLSMLVSMVLLSMGLATMWVATQETRITGNMARRAEALYAAEAGLERATAFLAGSTVPWNTILAGCGAKDDDPKHRGNVICVGGVPLARVQVISGKSAAKLRLLERVQYTIFVRNDRAEHLHCDGKNDPGDCNGDGKSDAVDAAIRAGDGDGRIVLRAEARARDGITFFAIENVVLRAGKSARLSQSSQEGGTQFGQHSADTSIPPPGS